MLKDLGSITELVAMTAVLAAVGCSSKSSGSEGGCPAAASDAGAAEAGCPAASKEAGCPAASQTPPQGAANIEAWLKSGAYKKWAGEAAPHASRDPSPHGINRIYSNEAIASNASGTGPWPAGAAAVKEIYKSESDPAPSGYAVYAKTTSDSGGGAGWYWYASEGGNALVDGLGGSGTAKAECVGCHSAAGSDGAHTPSPGGRDFVYTPVR